MNALFLRYLREGLGFTGYVNSDTMAVTDMAWGSAGFTFGRMFRKSNQCWNESFFRREGSQSDHRSGGTWTRCEAKIDGSVSYLLTEMMKLGLFENLYVDPDEALQIVNNPESQTKAAIAIRNQSFCSGMILDFYR